MTIAIVTTGDEIVHGDTLNTNGQRIAQILSSEGFPLGLHLSCCDDVEKMVQCLQFVSQDHDFIILIGGLGPTTDDLTRFALSEFTHSPLIEHAEALHHVKMRLEKAKVAMNEGNLQQCLFPAEAHLLANPHGSALGCYYQWQKWRFFLLPGPPRECLPMFEQHVLPRLQNSRRSTKQLLKWRIFGLAESEIASVLEEALKDIDCHTGYRLDVPYIEFKVRCKQESVAEVKRRIDKILAPHSITKGTVKASEALFERIVALKQPLCILDEATGGLLQTLLTRPESKSLLSFSEAENRDLVFKIEGLTEYWSNKPPRGETNLSIFYTYRGQEGSEVHSLPYRSPLVLHYAAEWLSFRLLHLINQLHQGIT